MLTLAHPDESHMQKYGRFGELFFYELDHESKMRLLKTHSHTSNGLAMEPGTREEKQLKETQALQQGKSHPSKTFRVPRVWRGGRKGSRICRMSPVWRGGAGKGLRQTNHYGEASPRRYGGEHRR